MVRIAVSRLEPWEDSAAAGVKQLPVTQWMVSETVSGTLYGVGVGPGDPELLT